MVVSGGPCINRAVVVVVAVVAVLAKINKTEFLTDGTKKIAQESCDIITVTTIVRESDIAFVTVSTLMIVCMGCTSPIPLRQTW